MKAWWAVLLLGAACTAPSVRISARHEAGPNCFETCAAVWGERPDGSCGGRGDELSCGYGPHSKVWAQGTPVGAETCRTACGAGVECRSVSSPTGVSAIACRFEVGFH